MLSVIERAAGREHQRERNLRRDKESTRSSDMTIGHAMSGLKHTWPEPQRLPRHRVSSSTRAAVTANAGVSNCTASTRGRRAASLARSACTS